MDRRLRRFQALALRPRPRLLPRKTELRPVRVSVRMRNKPGRECAAGLRRKKAESQDLLSRPNIKPRYEGLHFATIKTGFAAKEHL